MKVIYLTLTLCLVSLLTPSHAAKLSLSEIRGFLEDLFGSEEEESEEIVQMKELNKKACNTGAVFVVNRTTGHGTIDFPAGPDSYSWMQDCGWIFMGGPNTKTEITFTAVNLEHDHICEDYLLIHDIDKTIYGTFTSHTMTQTFVCPEDLDGMPQTKFVSENYGIMVQFHSDWWNNQDGFTLTYNVSASPWGGAGDSGEDRPNPRPPPPDDNSAPRDEASLSCTFEQENLCAWRNGAGSDVYWTVQVAGDSEWDRWGLEDHTTGSDEGSYAYLDTNTAKPGSQGKLSSQELPAGPPSTRCLTFWYNMWKTDGLLKVSQVLKSGGSKTVLQLDGTQGNGWHKGTVVLESDEPYNIEFQHFRGNISTESGVAIDDIQLSNGTCSTTPSGCGTNSYGKRDLLDLLKVIKREDEEDHILNDLYKRIVGGQPAKKGQHPWIVHMRFYPNGTQNVELFFQCGGSLIAQDWVLTAAHCLEHGFLFWKKTNTDPEKVRLYIGEHSTRYNDLEATQAVIKPTKIIIHPQRGFWTGHQYDIALMKLSHKVPLTDSVNIVCLPDKPFPPGSECVAAGWGKDAADAVSTKLYRLEKTLLSPEECSEMDMDIEADQLCAIGSGHSDVCAGDSGGPLACEKDDRSYLVGAVSYGAACAAKQRTPGVYVNVYNMKSWIETTMSNN